LQLTQKVLLNSFYGVLGLKTFRFHDLDNAGAITATGQSVIKFSAKVINNHYAKETRKDHFINATG
jgi:DNA polymerase elongation subunit (family B)